MSTLVRHVMTESPKTLGSAMSAEDAAGLMAQYDVGVIPVVDDGRMVGLVTDRDLVVRVLASRADPAEVRLDSILTKDPVSASPDMRLGQARELMQRHRVRRLPVMKADRLVGIVSLGDLAVADPSRRAIGETLEAISRSDATSDMNPGPTIGTPERP
jgi:CBS domain-containing protein